jgi:hypothetical protein
MSLLAPLLLLAAAASAGAPGTVAGAGGPPITWKGKTLKLEALPADLGDAPRRALTEWAEYAAENDYRLDLDPEGRLVLATPRKGGGPDAALRLVAKTAAWFEALFPVPKAESAPPAPVSTGGSAGGTGGIPEDPEAPPPGAPPTRDGKPASGAATSSTWGSGSSLAPDSRTAVMFVVRDEEAFGELVDALAKKQAYLAEWAATARKQPGFVLEDPLCGAYVLSAKGQEEWSPDHELVHRVAQLLLLRRFGQQPFWLTLAVGWEAEYVHDGTHYCYPYRDEFVWAVEHAAWPTDLASEFQDRADRPFDVAEVASWRRGRFEVAPARKAWGFLHVAARTHPAALTPLLADLARFRAANDRRATGPGTWERIPGYEIPSDEQARLVEKHLGRDFGAEAGEAFRKGLKTLKPVAKSAARPRG